ncbi:hypothetical protein [Gordonia insulae]|uniref:DUF5642 domain-containing protein n=1 Tax=Gordonia insulae TaxID=2420509 RepID=A0A3G8JNU1_9ACTN|nr:hypothetical protein [Gordonia insulae]AZG46129.1 hypothetical protein D7316_02730 [Gordonia insulae]
MRVQALRGWGYPVIGMTVAVVTCAAVAGCGSSSAPDVPLAAAAPADLLLTPDDLPGGFAPTQLSVTDLVAGNRGPIESATSAEVTPPECRPTADAALNPELDKSDSAVLAARSESASLVELVTTVRRDIESDIRVTTGRCATTTTLIGTGNLRGTRIVTRYTELPDPDLGDRSSALEQSLVLRSSVTTTLPDGAAMTQEGFAGYAIVGRPGGGSLTVQLTVAGDTPPAAMPPAVPPAPMSDAAFGDLFDDAVSAAAS